MGKVIKIPVRQEWAQDAESSTRHGLHNRFTHWVESKRCWGNKGTFSINQLKVKRHLRAKTP